jgi:hypothetical protein
MIMLSWTFVFSFSNVMCSMVSFDIVMLDLAWPCRITAKCPRVSRKYGVVTRPGSLLEVFSQWILHLHTS